MEREKLYKHIGKQEGKLLVFGGVYSNLQALQALKLKAEEIGAAPSHIICTGDIVAYCAQPEECVQLIKEWGIHCIAGNVEIQLREGLEDCGCNFEDGTTCDILSNSWYPYAQSKLSQDSIDYMKSLPDFIRFEYNAQQVLVLHGSLDETAGYVFKSTELSMKEEILLQANADIVLAGHCGLPFKDKVGDKQWINAGVIGMPANDGTKEVWYSEINDDKGITLASHHRLSFDHNTASLLMKEQSLPSQYADTLISGIWDNCDILPEVETSAQGVKLDLS